MVFGQVWRIVLASIIAFWAGEFVNSFVLARMKILTPVSYTHLDVYKRQILLRVGMNIWILGRVGRVKILKLGIGFFL